MAKVERAQQPGGGAFLNDAHRLLAQLHSSVVAEAEDPLIRIAERFRACTQDLERAELLYSSGFDASKLSEALGLSLRRVYQLLRLARLPIDIKNQIRSSGISERRLRPLLKQCGPGELAVVALALSSGQRSPSKAAR